MATPSSASKSKPCAVIGCTDSRLHRHYCAKHHNASLGKSDPLRVGDLEKCLVSVLDAIQKGVDATHQTRTATLTANPASPYVDSATGSGAFSIPIVDANHHHTERTNGTQNNTNNNSSNNQITQNQNHNEYIRRLQPITEKILENIRQPTSAQPLPGSALDIFSFSSLSAVAPSTSAAVSGSVAVSSSRTSPPRSIQLSQSDSDLGGPPSPDISFISGLNNGPIIDIKIQNSKQKKKVPLGFDLLEKSISGKYEADLNKSGSGKSVMICFQRGEEPNSPNATSAAANLAANESSKSESDSESGSRRKASPPAPVDTPKPITSLSVIFRDSNEEPPYGFVSIDRSTTGGDANLNNHSGNNGRQVYLCVHRGEGAPLYDIGLIFHDKKETLPAGFHELKHTPFGNRADLNAMHLSSSTDQPHAPQQAVFICFRPHVTPVLQSYPPLLTDRVGTDAASKGHLLYAKVLALLTALLYSYDQKMVLHALEGFMKIPVESIPPILLNRFLQCVCDAAPCFQTYFTTQAHTALLKFLAHAFKTFYTVMSIETFSKILEVCFLTRHEDKQNEVSEGMIAALIAKIERAKPCVCSVAEKKGSTPIGMNTVAGGEGHSKPAHHKANTNSGTVPAAAAPTTPNNASSASAGVSSILCAQCLRSRAQSRCSLPLFCRELVLDIASNVHTAKDLESEVKAFQRHSNTGAEFRKDIAKLVQQLAQIDNSFTTHIEKLIESTAGPTIAPTINRPTSSSGRASIINNAGTNLSAALALVSVGDTDETSPVPASTTASANAFAFDEVNRPTVAEKDRLFMPNKEERFLQVATLVCAKFASEPVAFGLTKSEQMKRKLHALRLLFYILHNGVYFFRSTPGGILLVRRFICPALMNVCVTDNSLMWRLLLQTFTVLYDSYRQHLMIEIGVFFDHILLGLLESAHVAYDLKSSILEMFHHILAKDPHHLVDLFYNYDNTTGSPFCFTPNTRLLLASGRTIAARDCRIADHNGPATMLMNQAGQPVPVTHITRGYDDINKPMTQMYKIDMSDEDDADSTTHQPLIVSSNHIVELICQSDRIGSAFLHSGSTWRVCHYRFWPSLTLKPWGVNGSLIDVAGWPYLAYTAPPLSDASTQLDAERFAYSTGFESIEGGEVTPVRRPTHWSPTAKQLYEWIRCDKIAHEEKMAWTLYQPSALTCLQYEAIMPPAGAPALVPARVLPLQFTGADQFRSSVRDALFPCDGCLSDSLVDSDPLSNPFSSSPSSSTDIVPHIAWLVGMWLADQDTMPGDSTLHPPEGETRLTTMERIAQIDEWVWRRQNPGQPSIESGGDLTPSWFRAVLVELGILHTKCWPSVLFGAEVSVRRSALGGLIDGGGVASYHPSAPHAIRIEVASNEAGIALADGAMQIARGIGYAIENRRTYNQHQQTWTYTINGIMTHDQEHTLPSIVLSAAASSPLAKPSTPFSSSIFTLPVHGRTPRISLYGSGPTDAYVGLTVPGGLLLTADCLVAHNSNHSKNWVIFERLNTVLARITEGEQKSFVPMHTPQSTHAQSTAAAAAGTPAPTHQELADQQEEALQRQALKLLVHNLHMLAQWVGVPGLKRSPTIASKPLITPDDDDDGTGMGVGVGSAVGGSPTPTNSKEHRASRIDTWSWRHDKQKQDQKILQEALKLARTEKLKSALQYLRIVDPSFQQPKAIAHFLYTNDGLDKSEVGDFLGSCGDKFMSDADYEALRAAYLEQLDFTGLLFDQGLRLFLCDSGFRLPGEAQKIDRLLEAFCVAYCHDNPNVFRNHSSAFIVSFALVMLNTDLHDSRLKSGASRRQPMTEEQFIGNLRGVDDQRDFPRVFLETLYKNIAASAIEWKEKPKGGEAAAAEEKAKDGQTEQEKSEDQQKAVRKTFEITIRRALAYLKNWAAHEQGYNRTSNTMIAAGMFEVIWYRIISAITLRSDGYKVGDVELLHVCLDGLSYGSAIAICLGLPTERQAFSRQLAKITFIERNRESIKANGLHLRIVQGEHLKQEWYRPFNLICEKSPARACAVVFECAHDIKQKINYERRQAKLRQIQADFNQEIVLVDPARSFVKEGVLTKLSNSSAAKKQYTFLLFNDCLLYASDGTTSKWKCHRVIHLSLCRLEDLRGIAHADAHAFRIVSPQKSFVVSAPSKEKKHQWLEAIFHHLKLVMAKRRKYIEDARKSSISAAAANGAGAPPSPSAAVEGEELLRRYSTFIGQSDTDLSKYAVRHDSGSGTAISGTSGIGSSGNLNSSSGGASSSKATGMCKLCIRPWAIFRRKQKCRYCADSVCNDCCSQKCMIPGGEKRLVNVCDACYGALKGMIGDEVKLLTVTDA